MQVNVLPSSDKVNKVSSIPAHGNACLNGALAPCGRTLVFQPNHHFPQANFSYDSLQIPGSAAQTGLNDGA